MRALSVTELNLQIKSLLESNFTSILVEGEVIELKLHNASGHYYLKLKDDKSSIKATIWNKTAKSILKNFKLENGQKIRAYGNLSSWDKTADITLSIFKIETLDNKGQMLENLEKLKKELESKGYFNNKLPKPEFPKRIALITALNSAALSDMLRISANRWNLVEIVVIEALMQGEGAASSIVKAIKYADSFYGEKQAFDIIVLARGGGSLEDLWAFNERIVAQAIYEARSFIVSAIGHESDVMLSDFVADLRAPTPSACMEMILPDSVAWLKNIEEYMENLEAKMNFIFQNKTKELENILTMFNKINYVSRFNNSNNQIKEIKHFLDSRLNEILNTKSLLININLDSSMERFLKTKENELLNINLDLHFKNFIEKKESILTNAQNMLSTLNPKNKVKNGFVEITKNGKVVNLDSLNKDDEITLHNGEISKVAKILN